MAKKKTSKKSVVAKAADAVKKTVKKAKEVVVKDGSDKGIITPLAVAPVQPLPKKE